MMSQTISDQTSNPFTILSQSIHGVVRLMQKPHLTTLQAFTGAGFQAVALDDEALQVFLRALPRETLQVALGDRCRDSLPANVSQEALPVLHWSIRPNLIACGRSDPIISSTALPQDVTCPECIDGRLRQVRPADDENTLDAHKIA